jgi:hypothetical protein
MGKSLKRNIRVISLNYNMPSLDILININLMIENFVLSRKHASGIIDTQTFS